MIEAQDFIRATKARGFGLYTGVPCSFLKPFINYVIDSPELQYIGAANEGESIAIASGAELGGVRSVAMFQNSGLGNAVNPLTSLNQTFKIPILLIVTLRGNPQEGADEPQHHLMGAITQPLLELMQIPWEYFPTQTEEIETVLDRAMKYMEEHQRPYALVMKKGSVSKNGLHSKVVCKPQTALSDTTINKQVAEYTRNDILQVIQAASRITDIIFTTTGYCGRELYALADRENQFYMVGSMGCVSSLGLGLALAQPQRRVIVIDGDGAALMRLGAMPTIGYERPANLCHILLDNQCHESTGGQATVSHSVNFSAIAASCGYENVLSTNTPETVKGWIQNHKQGLSFLHVKIKHMGDLQMEDVNRFLEQFKILLDRTRITTNL
jgi:phosphonopyruvate decarboxylase